MAVLFRRKTFVPRVSIGEIRTAFGAMPCGHTRLCARLSLRDTPGEWLRVKRELGGLSSNNDGVSIVLCYKWIMARCALNKAFLS